MKIRIKSNLILTPDGIFDGYVYTDEAKILAVTGENIPFDKEYDFTDRYVSPGFIELHTHGGGGHDFISPEPEEILAGVDFHHAHGVTSICPTVSAAPISKMRAALSAISAAKTSGRAKSHILGAHLEGPYLSSAQAGAQNSDFITPPQKADYEPLIAELGSDIARWTYAPENDPDGEFAKALKSAGILASAGHTDAIGSDIDCAYENGMRLITHLYSCTSTVTRDHGFRRLGVIEAAFLNDGIFTEIIADGKHLPPELLKLIIKIKGIDRIVAVTDCLQITGTDVKSGDMAGTPFIVECGVCRLADRSAFAGSIATTEVLLRTLTREAGLTIPDAVKTVTENPAELLGLKKGSLISGYDADITVFDSDFKVEKVFVGK